MGSLRNPVGPLPSSIYWRRRAVLLTVLALLALLATWVVVASSGGNGKDTANGSDGKNPVPSITPGPTGSGPAISQAPGGRDESPGSGGDTSGSGDGSDGSGNSNDGSGSGDAGGSGSSSGSGGGSNGDGSGADGGASGDQVPAGSSLPNCTAEAVKLTVRSAQNTYEPSEKPTFELIARNSSGSDCKVDLGPRKAVVTITQADGDEEIWSSADCPQSAGSLTFRVRAEGSATYTVAWDRKPSAPNCETPPSGSAAAGTYLVEAKAPGLVKAQTSFVLAKD
ncbi:hypothetical protein E0500_011995 [Streptomyces sp. KM273126]|uniref:hypothetical protein n=1 Tax=Streptomyces sp. KM273126 TaxID=2545247 RepID=UPI00103AA440|nr:hypothetical protein [Streptomyces sp. KM273126]MBA2808113.1 hypothetical protein [Streptomyces sp. KM273126]